ncbi:DUF1217 domain-containing protein [Falsirhodobacter sp. 20TX0035]|uniref:DUF1217 domain-containing protein n=1 Tax=Falsirhodobacter sp. 20TX0035 TaxID=3022019 RepID=UPI00232E161E|nr:DUF1217 domain-containing protein [Falsirhodobacter sp. 20TX0035]MDB6452492.1 DUF1217 domain-containing protein [Falsirhodobacter sp. 20TX0035]
MSFTPVVPMSGYAGWTFLQRTMDKQKDAFDSSATMQRDEAYFREKIGNVRTAEDLVSDRRLLKVALGAFGLDGDINNSFFIRKVLEEGTTEKSALANRLSDKTYRALSEAFGFDNAKAPETTKTGFADKILSRYSDKQFEAAVGEQNTSMRLALNAQRELGELVKKDSSDLTKWYTVLGSEPLRQVMQTAFNLPTAFASIDLDQQVRQIQDKFDSLMGTESLSTLSDPKQMDKLLKRFLTMSQITESANTVTSPTLQILQSGGSASNILSILR